MKKIILAILDGFGISEKTEGNAIKNADTKSIDKLFKEFPNSLLKASGEEVGLPIGQMGNSEVGHITIGSGRIVDQPLVRINKAIENKTFYSNEALLKAIKHAKDNNSKLHIIGLLSDGGVHSHIGHILSLVRMAVENDIKELYIHPILDGRDTSYKSAIIYLDTLQKYLNEQNTGKIATISGRYYAMDREKDYERTKAYYDALVYGGAPIISSYKTALEDSYKEEVYDEFVKPVIIDDTGIIEENDAVIIANFRPDRLVQTLDAFSSSEFNNFKVESFNNLKIVTMMPVSDKFNVDYAFKHIEINNTLGEILSNSGYRVLRISETTKFPHVTHFMDGDKDTDLRGTTKIRVPRKDVATYDMAPEMSAYEITEKIKYLIDDYDFVIVNYANGDMVGHTCNYESAKKAVESLDKSLRHLYELSFEKDILLIVTADHGNCEEMLTKEGNPHTNHTTNPVPLIVCDKNYMVENGKLSDIAPSILKTLNISIPKEMTGNVIIKEK